MLHLVGQTPIWRGSVLQLVTQMVSWEGDCPQMFPSWKIGTWKDFVKGAPSIAYERNEPSGDRFRWTSSSVQSSGPFVCVTFGRSLQHSWRAEDGAASGQSQIPSFKRRHQIDDHSILKLRLEHLSSAALQGCRQQGCSLQPCSQK